MCEPQHFDFVDLNLDFLDITPPGPTQGAPNATKCFIPPFYTDSKSNINNTDESISSRKNSKLQDLAKRIASTDLCVQQIQALQEERSQLQQQLQELQSSADDVRRLYDEESQERKRLKCLSDKLTIKCDSLQKEIINKSLSCDQLESELENIKRVPIDYNELVQCFLKLCSSYEEEVKPLHKPQLELVDKLKKYCKEHSIKTPEMIKRSPKKRIRKTPKPEAGIQCELWKMAPMPNESTTHVPKEMRSQGTQHISTTTTRSTCTSSFIKKHNVGTNFPEASLLPPVNDIVVEMLKWDIRPLSPICDFIPAARTEQEKLKKSTGTCTKLCNIQRSIDYIAVGQSLFSSIKRSNSRPPSRNMFDGFKHELPTPPPSSPPITPFEANNFAHLGSMSNALSAATFEDLWQVFGQMLFGLLGNRPDNWSTAARSGNAQSQQDFYNWLRSLYADITEHEQLHQQPQQQQQQPLSTTETCIGSSISNEGLNTIPQNTGNSQFIYPGRHEMYLTPTQGYVDTSQHTSIVTSPIRPSRPNSGDICKVIIPSQVHSEMQNINISVPFVTTEYQALNELNDENKKLGRRNIVNDILKLFPSTESTQETKKKLNKMLNIKRKRKSKRQNLNKNQKAEDVKEKSNTVPGKIELSTSVEGELREYSEINSEFSQIMEHDTEDIDQQNDVSEDSFSFSPTKEEKVLGESELPVDIRKLDGLSQKNYDHIENKADDVKLENGLNCFIPHNESEVPQGQTNELWVEAENSDKLEDYIKDAVFISPADENKPPQNQSNERWKDNDRNSVISCTEDEITDFIQDDIKDDYEENSCISLSENEVSQEHWSYNESTSAILQRKEEKIQQTEENFKDDYEKTSFSLSPESQVPQNLENERWYELKIPTVISCAEKESIEHIGNDLKEDYYEEISFIPSAENEEPHNEANVFYNRNGRSSAISCAEKENIEHLDDIKDDGEISLSNNQVAQNQGNNLWIENGRTSVPCCDRDENTDHLEDDKEEVKFETALSSTRSKGELESNQTEELKTETESTLLLPTFTENAVDFLSQLELTSYSLAQNETLTPFVYESPQSPTNSSNTNLEFCESSMDNNEFCSQSGYSSAYSAQDNNNKNLTATTCLMNSLFGSVTDSDSDVDIKDEFSAEEYQIQNQNAHPNQTTHLKNSFTFDYKVSNVENLNKLRPEDELNEQCIIKDVTSKCNLIEPPLKLDGTHYIHQTVEQQIEEDLPDFKPMTINIPPGTQKMSPPHIHANEPHKNNQPQWELLQNQINSNVTSTGFLIRQPMAYKKYKQIETNNYEVPFINKPNSAVLQAHDQELENVPPSSVTEDEPPQEHFKLLEGKTYECNLVIDEDCCNTSSEHSQDNASFIDATYSTNDADKKARDSSNEQNGTKNEARRINRNSEEVEIEEVQNQISTQNITKPPAISTSKLQSSPAKEIRENLIKYEAASKATATTNNGDDHFNNYLNNVLRDVAPRNVSPISIISNSIPSATPIKNDDDAYQSEPRKRGRKRKSSLSPNTAPTAAIACKRSVRFRFKEKVNEAKLDTTFGPLQTMSTIKIDKYSTNHEDDYEKYHKSLDSNANTIDDEETLSVSTKLDYFSKRSTAMCDPAEDKTAEEKATKTQNMHQSSLTSPNTNLRCNQPIGYQGIFQSFADQHRKCLQKKKPENWAAIPPMQQTSNDELIEPHVRLNCDIAKNESSIDHAAEQQYESPASPNALDTTDTLASPASPSADLFEATSQHGPTKEIPLEPDSTLLKVQHSSLLQRLIANHSSSLHQLVMDTFNKKYSNSIQAQLCPLIKKFLIDTDDTNAEAAAIQVLPDLLVITLNIKHITAAIVAVMQDVPRPEVELACALADVPPKYLGKQHRRISFVMRHIQQVQPNFTSELMGHIEGTLFNYNTNENLSLAATLNLTQLYLLTLSICMPDMQKNPARLFVAKCLYYYNLKAAPMIYEVLCCFPTTLPHREERSYDRADALINVIQHLLMSRKYDMDKKDLRTKEFLSKLRFEYHFEAYQPERSVVLTNLVEKIKADKLENVSYAFALFCKRLPQPKVEADVLESQLMPLANEFYQIVTHSASYDSRIACLLECISMVIKPFRMDTNIAIYMSIFSRFLNVVTRATPQEAAVRAIIRCQRFGYVNCYNELLNFKPCYELQPITKAMLETFIYRKTAKFWRSLNTSAVNLTF